MLNSPVGALSVRPKVIAVVIPCFRVAKQIVGLIHRIGPECAVIFAVDDCCPEQSGQVIRQHCNDARVRVLVHDVNQGVGGAMVTGYRAALDYGADIIVKIDGDGQMDPSLINKFCEPIASGRADYVKGNRFYNLEDVQTMPKLRLFGNVVLTFLTKLSSGYWSIFDPNNGYLAIDARVLSNMPLNKISKRYFFESDMLFRLNTLRAKVVDMPMRAVYADESSSLRPHRIVSYFFARHVVNFGKRLFYNFFLRDFSLASVELLVGVALLAFGMIFGGITWYENGRHGVISTPGTVMLSVLPILMGLQFLLGFVGFDMSNSPTEPVGRLIETGKNAWQVEPGEHGVEPVLSGNHEQS